MRWPGWPRTAAHRRAQARRSAGSPVAACEAAGKAMAWPARDARRVCGVCCGQCRARPARQQWLGTAGMTGPEECSRCLVHDGVLKIAGSFVGPCVEASGGAEVVDRVSVLPGLMCPAACVAGAGEDGVYRRGWRRTAYVAVGVCALPGVCRPDREEEAFVRQPVCVAGEEAFVHRWSVYRLEI